jgi:S1-C subfamily serine protease
MTFPRLPDWLVYSCVVAAVLVAAQGRQEKASAPPPPPVSAGESEVQSATLEAVGQVKVPESLSPSRIGTAFSVADGGVWLTARHVVDHCRQVAVIVSEGRGVTAQVRLDPGADIAVLFTQGGAPPLPLATAPPERRGDLAYQPGFPKGTAGEIASRYLGPSRLPAHVRGGLAEPVLAWAEVGRTDGLTGVLSGLSGAPVLDPAGRVMGVTLGEAPRRGRIYSTTPQSLTRAMVLANREAGPVQANESGSAAGADLATGEPITVDNYGRVADSLRRDLRVVQVACLGG